MPNDLFYHVKINLERLKKGKLKFLILECLNEKPMHTYEIIKTIEKKFGGIYKPSPGSVYPVLKNLINQKLVGVDERDSKKVYYITEEGRAEYSRMKEKISTFFATHNEYRKLVSKLMDVGLLLYSYKEELREEKYEKVSQIVDKCREEIESILREGA
jgi:DNA-binding PadR family transcriptional regulator